MKPEELHHLDEVYQANWFPPELVHSKSHPRQLPLCRLRTLKRKSHKRPGAAPMFEANRSICLRLKAEEVREHLCNSGHPFSLHPEMNLNDSKVKTQKQEERKRSVVYQNPCNNWDHVSMGESKGTFKFHMAEHREVVQKSDPNRYYGPRVKEPSWY